MCSPCPVSTVSASGPDPVVIDGDNTWRLNRTTGRIEPISSDGTGGDD
jgi:hypothetical protein